MFPIKDKRDEAIAEISSIAALKYFPKWLVEKEPLKTREYLVQMGQTISPYIKKKLSDYKTEDLTGFLTTMQSPIFQTYQKILMDSHYEAIEAYANGTLSKKCLPEKLPIAEMLAVPMINYWERRVQTAVNLQSHIEVISKENLEALKRAKDDNFQHFYNNIIVRLTHTPEKIEEMIAISKNPLLKAIDEFSEKVYEALVSPEDEP
jgi:hypothetical protein